ncbi:hypothetical protein [Mycobacteroides salmoniphilum]|nr:hypothetical protein [Mycobacteroides salmoniphilum]
MSDDPDRHIMTSQQSSGELWSIGEVANYLGCSESRARALLASRAIPRISGYPADQVRQIQRRQGHRTDLIAPPELGPIQEAVLRQLGGASSGWILPGTWTADKVAQAIDPSPNGTGMRPLVEAGLKHLHHAGYAESADRDSWRLTSAGREALTQLHAQDSRNRDEQPAELPREELDRILEMADRIHGRVAHFIGNNRRPDSRTSRALLASLSAALPPADSYPEWLEDFARDHAAKLTSIFDAHREAEPGHPLRSPVSIIIFERLTHTPAMFEQVAARSNAITEQDVAFFQSAWCAT